MPQLGERYRFHHNGEGGHDLACRDRTTLRVVCPAGEDDRGRFLYEVEFADNFRCNVYEEELIPLIFQENQMPTQIQLTNAIRQAASGRLSADRRDRQPERWWQELAADLGRLIIALRDYSYPFPKFYGLEPSYWLGPSYPGAGAKRFSVRDLLYMDIVEKTLNWEPNRVQVVGRYESYRMPVTSIGGYLSYRRGKDVEWDCQDDVRAALFGNRPATLTPSDRR